MKRNAILFTALVGSTIGGGAFANTIGTSSQLFNPATSSSDFVTVQSSKVIEQGWYSFGMFLNHASNPLPYKETATQSRSKGNDSLTGMDAFVGYGLLPKTEIGIVFPFIVNQSVREDETRGEFEEKGNTEVRALIKHNFLKKSNLGMSIIASSNVNRTAEDPYTGANTTPAYNFELVTDMPIGNLLLAGNLGYRYRKKGEPIEGALTDSVGSEYMVSLAAKYQIHSKLSVLAEAFAGKPEGIIENETDRKTESAEALLGARYKTGLHTWAHIGAGSEMLHGYGTADWRAYVGIVTEFGPGTSKGKAIVKKKKSKTEVFDEDNFPTDIPVGEPDEIFVLRNINFEFDSDYRVLPGAVDELQKLTDHLASRPFVKIIVAGHTDYYGTDDYNDELSMRRATAVRRQMVKYYGFSPSKLTPVGFGEQVPFTDDLTDAGRQLNRRVEIKIYYMDSH